MSYSRRSYGGSNRSHMTQVGSVAPPARLPGAAYTSSRRGRPANPPTTHQYNTGKNPLSIQPTSRSKVTKKTSSGVTAKGGVTGTTRAGSGTKRVTGSSHHRTSVRSGGAAVHKRGQTTTTRVSKPSTSTSRGRAPRSSGSGRSSSNAPAPRSSQHRAVGKSSSLQVGQYLVGKVIGQGTFGKVKLGVHVSTGEKVAIKILEKKKIVEVADVERVSREILILKRVGAVHDNVIRLFEVIDTPKAIYLIMEYCSGGELFDFIVKHGKIKEKQACNFFHQILNGVEYLHKCSIVHRDLKPENLLMNRRPEGWNVKVVDFGLSNTDDGGRLLKTACGSPCYAAPEMIAGKKYVGPKADMWSLGVVLFALVCGFLPFEHDNTSELYKKILKGDYKCPKFISPQVKDLLSKILNTNPKQRYSIAQARKHPWMQMVSVKNIHHAAPEITRGPKMSSLATRRAAAAAGGSGESSTSSKSNSPKSPMNAGNILANIDQQVLRQCADLGFKPALVVEGLVNKLENQATQAYRLLCSRKVKIASAQKKKKEAASSAAPLVNAAAPPQKSSVAQSDAVSERAAAAVVVSKVPAKGVTSTAAASSAVMATVAAVATVPVVRQSAGESTASNLVDPAVVGTEEDGSSATSPPISALKPESASMGGVRVKEEAGSSGGATVVAGSGAGGRGRRVVPSANQNRSELPQQPRRPTAPPAKKTAGVERNALQSVTLEPMMTENNTAGSDLAPLQVGPVNSSDAQAWQTPRVDENGLSVAVVPHSAVPLTVQQQQQQQQQQTSLSARGANDAKMSTLLVAADTTPNGSQTSRPAAAVAASSDAVTVTSSQMDVVKGAFNVSHTSSKPPSELIAQIKRVLQQSSVPFSMAKEYQMTCHKQNTRFKVEICKLENVEKVHLVRCVRLAGDQWAAKQIAKTIMGKLRL